MYALILAGGSGTRLWPYSRHRRPKQFLRLGGATTMLQETVSRTLPIIPLERVFVATGAEYTDLVAEQLPDLPPENILAEPTGRGTAPCIGLAALHLRRRDPDAVVAVLSADHRVERADDLCEALTVGANLARQGRLVALGIQPAAPSTGYGYIQRGELFRQIGGVAAYVISRFVEKPDARRARAFFESGDYCWNAGMFVWRADRVLDELAAHRPALAQALAQIDAAIGAPTYPATLDQVWRGIESVAIDVAVLERTENAVVIPAALGWSDVGDWASFAETLTVDEYGNAVVGSHVGLNTYDTLVYGNDRVVATIGVADLMIIDTEDVLLVCPRSRAQEVKAIVARVRERDEKLT